MIWKKCSVTFNSGMAGAFYTGDIVTGSINFVFKSKPKLENITCEIIGTSEAQWTRSMPTIPYIKIYSEKNKVLNLKLDICEQFGRTGSAGLNAYQFNFALPENLPSSIETSVAKVKYYVKIKGKVGRILKKKQYFPFTVIARNNLNSLESFKTPFFIEFTKMLWKSGRVCLCLKTFRGFAPKQILPFELVVANENRTKINKIQIYLIQKLDYTVSSGYAKEEFVISKCKYKNISNDDFEICHFNLTIPKTLPSSIHESRPMIEISYVLRVEVMFLFHFSLYEDIPVTVASEPVMHYDNEQIKSILKT